MPICKLCERHFEQHEIEEGVEVQHAGSGRLKLVRFLNGNLHQFKHEKKKSVMPKGAAVTPPKPVEAPPMEVAETSAVTEAPSVKELAETLTAHFENPTGQIEAHSAEPEPEPQSTSFYDQHATEEIGNFVDGIVVMYDPILAKGYIRILEYDREKSGLFFRTHDIMKGDFIGLGVKVRCLVCDPEPGREALTARQIEVLELDPKERRKPRMRIYIHEEN